MKSKRDSSVPKGRQLKQEALSYVLKTLGNLDIRRDTLIEALHLVQDKEGYLRSKTSLIQTIGRAERHIEGKVILYANNITGSMQ